MNNTHDHSPCLILHLIAFEVLLFSPDNWIKLKFIWNIQKQNFRDISDLTYDQLPIICNTFFSISNYLALLQINVNNFRKAQSFIFHNIKQITTKQKL